MAILKKTYNNSNLNGSYYLIYTHNLNTEDIIFSITDGDGISYPIVDLIRLGDADDSFNNKANVVSVLHGQAITGTYKLLLSYTSSGESVSGRKAFELTENNDPPMDSRLVFGKALTPAFNMTLTNWVAWLLTKLGFLKVSENLNDLNNKETARTNLGVYSTSAVDSALSTKATLLQANSGAVIGVGNTSVYTPSANYHPATKKFVEGQTETGYRKGAIITGTVHYGDIPSSGEKEVTITHSAGTSNYLAFCAIYTPNNQPGDNDVVYNRIKSKTDNNFVAVIYETAGEVQDIYIDWAIIITVES